MIRASAYSIALCMLIVYLVLPGVVFSQSFSRDSGSPVPCSSQNPADPVPGDCPCSDSQNSDCCDTTSCNCSCHAPISQGLLISYNPMVAVLGFGEPSCSIPLVYPSIFVPPQNAS